jgi:hypothetical protein
MSIFTGTIVSPSAGLFRRPDKRMAVESLFQDGCHLEIELLKLMCDDAFNLRDFLNVLTDRRD